MSMVRVHCLTNPVTMQDIAGILLAAGGSAIMAQAPEEAVEITASCSATLLNTGVPDKQKWEAFRCAGKEANRLSHPLILDPVGAGVSRFRRDSLKELLSFIHPDVIRCNQAEALALLELSETAQSGVEGSCGLSEQASGLLAQRLSLRYGCTALVSGSTDAVSDGTKIHLIRGGDKRMQYITGAGCMLSALCALFCGAGQTAFDAALYASDLWKRTAELAGVLVEENSVPSGVHFGTPPAERHKIGSFHTALFDALSLLTGAKQKVTDAEQKGRTAL